MVSGQSYTAIHYNLSPSHQQKERPVPTDAKWEFFSYCIIWIKEAYYVIMHKAKHVLYRYFPKNSKLWDGLIQAMIVTLLTSYCPWVFSGSCWVFPGSCLCGSGPLWVIGGNQNWTFWQARLPLSFLIRQRTQMSLFVTDVPGCGSRCYFMEAFYNNFRKKK